MQGDWNATSREVAASQSSNQPEITSSQDKLGQENGLPNPASKPVKRIRGPGKFKSPAPKESEEQASPGCASKTPSGSAKAVSSLSGETKKVKEQRQVKGQPQANKICTNRVQELKGVNFKVPRVNQR